MSGVSNSTLPSAAEGSGGQAARSLAIDRAGEAKRESCFPGKQSRGNGRPQAETCDSLRPKEEKAFEAAVSKVVRLRKLFPAASRWDGLRQSSGHEVEVLAPLLAKRASTAKSLVFLVRRIQRVMERTKEYGHTLDSVPSGLATEILRSFGLNGKTTVPLAWQMRCPGGRTGRVCPPVVPAWHTQQQKVSVTVRRQHQSRQLIYQIPPFGNWRRL